MKRYDKNKISYSIDVNFLSIPVPRICYHLLICISQKSNAWYCKPRSFDEKFRFLFCNSLIWLISVRDLKGLLFLHETLSPLKIFLFQCFLLVPGLGKILLHSWNCFTMDEKKWYVYKKGLLDYRIQHIWIPNGLEHCSTLLIFIFTSYVVFNPFDLYDVI